MARQRKFGQFGYRAGDRQTRALDDLIDFERFQAEVLPALRKDLANGMASKDLLAKYEALAAAREISIALTSADEKTALAAIKDIQDRSSGKAAESKTVDHPLENVPDNQLDALLESELTDLEDMKH